MLSCPSNATSFPTKFDNVQSHYFIDAMNSSVYASFLILFGSIQLFFYRKDAIRIDHAPMLSKSRLFALQLFLSFLMPVTALVRLWLNSRLYADNSVYGYMALSTVLICIAYPYSICMILTERQHQLESLTNRGHGLVLLLFWTLALTNECLTFINLRHFKSNMQKIEMGILAARLLTSLMIFILGLKAPEITHSQHKHQPLDEKQPQTEAEDAIKRSAFKNAFKNIKNLLPYMWPKNEISLQINMLLVILLIVAERVITPLLPIYNKKILDSLTIADPVIFRWDLLLIHNALGALQHCVINNLRPHLLERVEQYSTRKISIHFFQHLHQLSLRWHLQRKTGGILRLMENGSGYVITILNYIIFTVLPSFFDLIIANIYFIYAFNWWFGLILFITLVSYIVATILIIEWRTKFERNIMLADDEQRTRSVDSLLNFETVKYYGAEQYEVDAYREAILKYQKEESFSSITYIFLEASQSIIQYLGILIGSMLCVYLVVHHSTLTVGDFVLFSTYLWDLYSPLNTLGYSYRTIQDNFVDMEKLFDILNEEKEIIDAPDAAPLLIAGGGIEFSNVSFGYTPEKIVLRNVSFSVPPGKTVAFVGPSGAGKSTIIRLLFRFYDVESGAIFIDGQNIKLVQQQSLRKSIGVVPQDTVLFNNTIYYNIEYGRIGATAEEIYEAARMADMHERILSFPDRYETKVGERGLLLSGGEKQRVAIARTLLKSPKIVLLDEATSALDTHTERNIQAALSRVCSNRTTVIIAHRLSTIIHADEILVLKDGSIAERGRHEDLLNRKNGVYASMWLEQLRKTDVSSVVGEADENDTTKP